MKKYIFCAFCITAAVTVFSQNTGIGTTTPAAKLEVKGDGTTSATTSLQVVNNAGLPLFNVQDNGNVQVLSGSLNITGPLKISGSGGSAGQVLTSNGSSAPSWQTTQQNPQVGFSATLSGNQTVNNFSYTLLAP